ncbi:MAG TPA: RNA polymerase sigma factor [Candidatus Dormibacteraeota bacterium]
MRSPRAPWSGLRAAGTTSGNRALRAAARPPAGAAEGAVEAACRGDAAGWNWLFDRYHRVVLRHAMARIGDLAAAEDVTQEVFVAAVGGIGRLRDRSEAGVEGWLLGIARNTAIDRVRRLRRERVALGHPEVTADAAELVVSRISAAELRTAMEQLSAEQREVVLRRFVLDQSLEQVAAATGRPVGAVKSMQHRALASLARICGGEAR